MVLNKEKRFIFGHQTLNKMKTGDFFLETANDVKNINLIVQTAKNNNSATQFTNAQKAAIITAAGTAIDKINTMRTEIYAAQTPSITETFASYDNTAAGNAGIYTEITPNVESLRITFSEMVAGMTDRYTKQTLDTIVDSINNLIISKSGTYTTAQTAAITAIANLQTALFA